MKLLSYMLDTRPTAGVLVADHIHAVAPLLGTAPLADVGALLELGGDALQRLRTAVEGGARTGGMSLSQARLLAPVRRPPTLRDFMTYEGHASGGGKWKLSDAWYRLPVFYFSNPLCIFGPGEQVPYPSATEKFDYELELAAVVGREGSNISEKDAFDYIAGFTILNDWSSRDLQRDEMQTHLGPANTGRRNFQAQLLLHVSGRKDRRETHSLYWRRQCDVGGGLPARGRLVPAFARGRGQHIRGRERRRRAQGHA